jgi:mitogen-activated protein kinase kinase kinase
MSFSSTQQQSRFSNDTLASEDSQPKFSNPPPSIIEPSPSSDSEEISNDNIPRMSISTEDGHSVELQDTDVPIPSTAVPPQLLPPIPFPTQSFAESFDDAADRRASKRMSYMTELRSKRDLSDTASLMTVDEITAEVESRRASKNVDNGSDTDEWTRVDSDDVLEHDVVEDTLKEPEEVAPTEVDGEAEALEDDDDPVGDEDEDDEPEAMTSRGGW